MSMPVFCCNSYNAYRSLRDKFAWQNLQYLVANKPLFGSKLRLGEVNTSMDNTTAQRFLFLDSSFFFFFQLDSHFFLSTLILKSRLVFFFSFVNICFAWFCKSRLIIFITFRVFYKFRLSRIMFSTCFYYRYNFVLNGTSYHNLETDWSEKNHLPIKYLSKWIPINCNVSHVIL